MNELYCKVSSEFKFDWNPCEFESKFIPDKINTNPISSRPLNDSSGLPHWQWYPTANIFFARNFSKNFPDHCDEVCVRILKLIRELKREPLLMANPLIKTFVEHPVSPSRINVMKGIAGVSILPHIDYTRELVLNIGLLNANTGRTEIINTVDTESFDSHQVESFIMEDGDAYLVKVMFTHRVTSLVTTESNLDRYVITYNMNTNQ